LSGVREADRGWCRSSWQTMSHPNMDLAM
jgi:hypothetical protein